MYYFYILRCCDDSLYCGVTTNTERRLKEHNSNTVKGAKYTRSRKPVMLVYVEKHETKQKAMQREYEVKQWTKSQKEALL